MAVYGLGKGDLGCGRSVHSGRCWADLPEEGVLGSRDVEVQAGLDDGSKGSSIVCQFQAGLHGEAPRLRSLIQGQEAVQPLELHSSVGTCTGGSGLGFKVQGLAQAGQAATVLSLHQPSTALTAIEQEGAGLLC